MGLFQFVFLVHSRLFVGGAVSVSVTEQVVEDGYQFFGQRRLVTIFSAPNYCNEFDNAGAMMSVDETLMCSFQVRYVLLTVDFLCDCVPSSR